MKFILDGMLGKLSRWLRMLGQDVQYSTQLEDSQLLKIAKDENRILLTRDFELYQRAISKGIDGFYLKGATEAERLAELADRYCLQLTVDMDKSRCPICNAKLEAAQKESLMNKVEKNTFLHYEKFWVCPKCSQVYWQGAHWNKINATLETAKKNFKRKLMSEKPFQGDILKGSIRQRSPNGDGQNSCVQLF